MNTSNIQLGTFDSEKLWRDPLAARLPSIKAPSSNHNTARMDELLFPWRKDSSAFLTKYSMNKTHLGYLQQIRSGGTHAFLHETGRQLSDDHDHYDDVKAAEIIRSQFDGAILRPYAITEPLIELATRLGAGSDFPNLSAVRKVNSKSFSTAIGPSLEGRCFGVVVRTIEDLSRVVQEYRHSWLVVKDSFGVSGSGQYLIRDSFSADRLIRHLNAQASSGYLLDFVVEPYTPFAKEFGSYYYIGRSGEITFEGLRSTKTRGAMYAGSHLPQPELLQTLREQNYGATLQSYCAAVWHSGYWGPVCFDSGVTREGILRPVIEINARLSMGMIAVDLCNYLAPFGVAADLWRLSVTLQEGVSYTEVHTHLALCELLWVPGMQTGIIPLTSGPLSAKTEAHRVRRVPWFIASVGQTTQERDDAWSRLMNVTLSGGIAIHRA